MSLKSGIDRNWLSADIRPQDDLFRHVNASWLDSNEIPSDRAAHGTFYELRDLSETAVRGIIQECAESNPAPGSEAQKVGDLFASFMDEERIEALGVTPLNPFFARIDAITSNEQFVDSLGGFYKDGVSAPFGMWVYNDAKQSDQNIVYLVQGGLGLPDESYYRDEKYADVREKYLVHMTTMLTLAGVPDAAAQAKTAYDLEAELAKSHWDVVRDRDVSQTYNKFTRAELEAATPGMNWGAFITGLQAPANTLDTVIVQQPSFFEALAGVLTTRNVEEWKSWMRWHLVSEAAPYLSKAFVDENFAFYGTTLSGTPQLKDRWKRGVAMVEGSLGEAVGKLYVEKYFPPKAKAKMDALVQNLIEAYRQDINALDWMGEETKKRALDKLFKFTPKIGYPDKWRDYSTLEIDRDDLFGNLRRAHDYEFARNLNKLGQPIDRTEWFMTPQTVNAYYNPVMNEIVFPAAILQPPFFDMDADDAVNYGAIGAVIGHEIGHGFDDQGSKFDGEGNINDWWTDDDRKRFEVRTGMLIEQYNALEPSEAPGNKVNGALTVGENIGDLGGLTVAFKAYQIALDGKEPEVIDGFTGYERFFLGWAQAWRSKIRKEEMVRRLAIDPHSPGEFRCNQVVKNLNEFYDTFGLTEADQLWLEEEQRVRIW
jgi:putative endopeptidase